MRGTVSVEVPHRPLPQGAGLDSATQVRCWASCHWPGKFIRTLHRLSDPGVENGAQILPDTGPSDFEPSECRALTEGLTAVR